MDLNCFSTCDFENFPTSDFVKYLLTNTTTYIKIYKNIKEQCKDILLTDTKSLMEILPTKLVNDMIKEIPKDIYDNVIKYAKYYYVINYGIKKYLLKEKNDILFNKYLTVLFLRSHSIFENEMRNIIK